uniref:Putative ovule protein n=1 Tax=Solanum chacoense TaxID=4108 RepID=A0A0V0GXZ4_SOLCH
MEPLFIYVASFVGERIVAISSLPLVVLLNSTWQTLKISYVVASSFFNYLANHSQRIYVTYTYSFFRA